MSVIEICKAQPVGDQAIESVTILIHAALPAFETLEKQDGFTEGQAFVIEQVLHNSLPGATYDRLFAAMSLRVASHFRISWELRK
ncbi:hypothetical protein CCP3SC15_2440002 [Gammaproteobacteria bacterium]